MSSYSSIVQMIQQKAIQHPNKKALGFIVNDTEHVLTYADLNEQASATAAILQEMNMKGQRALLMYPPGLEYITAFFGCLYAGVIAVPIYPPRLNRSLDRINTIVKNAGATLSLTNEKIYNSIQSRMEEFPLVNHLNWLTSTYLKKTSNSALYKEEQYGLDELTFLQYTSGSTSSPKGVKLTNRNLLHNIHRITDSFELNNDTRLGLWLPPYHDMGLIGGILAPLFSGASTTLMAPVDFLQSPYKWLELISEHKMTVSGGPNFAYDLCVQTITDQQLDNLNLESWSLAFNGAEPVRYHTLQQFADKFSVCGFNKNAFFPCYGLAESTLLVSHTKVGKGATIKEVSKKSIGENQVKPPLNEKDSMVLVSSGINAIDQHIKIVNSDTSFACSDNQIGEIWLSSPSISAGYWDDEESTRTAFHQTLTNDDITYLATGDIGFVDEGYLYVTGRKKDLIVINGVNYYPQDIESIIDKLHPALRIGHGAAFSIENEDEEQLIIVHEIERTYRKHLDAAELAHLIRSAVLSELGVKINTIVFINTGKIPKTSSGKIQRQRCKQQYLKGEMEVLSTSLSSDYSADASALKLYELKTYPFKERLRLLENYMLEKIATILKLDRTWMDTNESITSWGFDSISALQLSHELHVDLNVNIPVTTLLDHFKLHDLIVKINDQLEKEDSSLPIVSIGQRSDQYELSYGQRALWFLQHYEAENTAYNISFAFSSSTLIDTTLMDACLQTLLERHEILRTSYPVHEGNPVARVHKTLDTDFQIIHISAQEDDQLHLILHDAAHLPFNLEQDSVFRLRIVRVENNRDVLLFTFHHIAVDLWSISQFIDEFKTIYDSLTSHRPLSLPPITYEYQDYIQKQQKLLQSEEGEQLYEYWKRQVYPPIEPIYLPLDRQRPKYLTYKGAAYYFECDSQLTEDIRTFVKKHGVTLNTFLLTVFQILLHQYSGQASIQIGTPMSDRSDVHFRNTLGYFVNPVVIKSEFNKNATFLDHMEQTRLNVLGAIEHQSYPFTLLLERLKLSRDLNANSLFQVMFVFEKLQTLNEFSSMIFGENDVEFKLGNHVLEHYRLDNRTTQFDLTLFMTEGQTSISGKLEYNTDLFNDQTIQNITDQFLYVLTAIIKHENKALSSYEMLDPKQQQLLLDWNATDRNYAAPDTLIELIEHQVERSPDAIAVRFEDRELTYRQLDQQANQLAKTLQQQGARVDTFVGLCTERSIEMMIGLLAILKAGAAYVPLDPSYPKERLAFMLADAQVPILLTQSHLVQQLPEHQATLILLDQLPTMTVDTEPVRREGITPDAAAYMIYTSGSTGRPKGVVNIQRAIINRLVWMQETYQLEATDRVLQKTPISFDVSVWELFWPLLAGAQVVIARPDGHKDPDYLVQVIQDQQITTLHFVPSMFRLFMEQPAVSTCTSLRRVLCSGEALPYELQEQWFTLLPSTALWNLYGPTEAAIDVTSWKCEPGEGRTNVPIGRPIANTQVYILNEELEPVPIGATGELYIGGVQLAREYYRRPELTAERFIPNPFAVEPGARLYKTGDLARYGADGTIEYKGRIDDQIKLRGFRIELGEIEAVLLEHPGVKGGAMGVQVDAQGYQVLLGYWVPAEGYAGKSRELRKDLLDKLPEYMVPARWTEVEAIPLTPSGKIDRKKLLEMTDWSAEPDRQYVAPSSPLEQAMANIWYKVLQIEKISLNDDFFKLGGHSLSAAQLSYYIRDEMRVDISVKAIFEYPKFIDLVALITKLNSNQESIHLLKVSKPKHHHFNLSFAQQRLWFMDKVLGSSVAYNVPAVIQLTGKLNIAAMEYGVNQLIMRHETLRTCFKENEGVPYIEVKDHLELSIEVQDVSELIESGDQETLIIQWAQQEAETPFDLSQAPLLRTKVLKTAADCYLFFITLHHIVSDGWSLNVLTSELTELYNCYVTDREACLPVLDIQYSEYSQWQRETFTEEVLEKQLNYWKEKLGKLNPALKLPADYRRPPELAYKGGQYKFQLSNDVKQRLHAIGAEQGATLFMTMLAAFNLLLNQYTNQTNIAIGSPIANRNHKEIESLIGFFVNTLVLRTDLSRNFTFSEWVTQVRNTCLEAYENQDVPFEKIVEVVQPDRHLNNSALFQTMFILENQNDISLNMYGLQSELVEVQRTTAKFDLTLSIKEKAEQLEGELEYNSEVFDLQTIIRMADSFTSLLENVSKHPNERISDLYLFQSEEGGQREQALFVQDNRQSEQTVISLFQQSVEQDRNATAIICGEERVTYNELAMKSAQLATALNARGIGQGQVVGVHLQHPLHQMIAILAVFKTGAAFTMVDDQLVGESFSDHMSALLIADELKVFEYRLGNVQLIALNSLSYDYTAVELVKDVITPEHLACVLLNQTSKDSSDYSLITQQYLVESFYNLDAALFKKINNKKFQTFMSVTDRFNNLLIQLQTLLHGHTLHLFHPIDTLEREDVLDYMATHNIEMWYGTPLQFKDLIRTDTDQKQLHQLKWIWLSEGEIDDMTWQRFTSRQTGTRMFYMYGNSETLGAATGCEMIDEQKAAIGHAFATYTPVIVNEYMVEMPQGAIGTLYFKYKFPNTNRIKMIPTGDVARQLSDGILELFGSQNEIAQWDEMNIDQSMMYQALYQLPEIIHVHIECIDDEQGKPQLAIYMICSEESSLSAQSVYEFLRSKLPRHMLPVYVKIIDFSFVLAGKIDRSLLPALQTSDKMCDFVVKPRTSIESYLLELWQELLGTKEISINDNFFEIGGHSLVAMQVVSHIRNAFGIQISIRELFDATTISELGLKIEAALIAEIESMDEEEVLALLDHDHENK